MACVLTAALRQDEQVTIGHIGDTRCYHLVGREMVKITSDHSPVGAQEDAGLLSEGAAMNHPARNQILRDLGSAPHTPDDPDFIDIYEFTATPASALLLCSDGLTDVLTANQIQDIISTHADEPKSVVRELIAAANAAGGPDNITAVLAGGPDYAKGKLSALPPASGKPASRRRVWLNRMLIFLLGFILGALAFWWTATRGPAKLRQRLVNLLQVAEK